MRRALHEGAVEAGAPKCTLMHLELPPASLEQSRDGEDSAASSPDRNLLVLSFTPAHNVIPQRPLAEERLEEQGLNFRGLLQLAGKKS